MGGFVHSKEPAECFAEECKRRANHLAKMKHTCIHCTDICCFRILRGLEAAGQGCGSMTKVKGAAGVATLAAPSSAPLSHLCRAGVWGQTDNRRQGTREWAAEGLGKASPWLAQPAAVTCPPWGYRPVCPPLQPRDLEGRCSSSLALATMGTSGLGQRGGCLLGLGRRAGPTALEDFGARFPPSLAGTQLRWWEFVGRNPPMSARLHEGEGRGTLSASPNPVRLARPASRSHTDSTLSPAPHPTSPRLGKQPAGASALTLFKPGSCRTKEGQQNPKTLSPPTQTLGSG